jgi:hypothetical protein
VLDGDETPGWTDWTELVKNLAGNMISAVKSMPYPFFMLPKLGFSTLIGPETLYLHRCSLK